MSDKVNRPAVAFQQQNQVKEALDRNENIFAMRWSSYLFEMRLVPPTHASKTSSFELSTACQEITRSKPTEIYIQTIVRPNTPKADNLSYNRSGQNRNNYYKFQHIFTVLNFFAGQTERHYRISKSILDEEIEESSLAKLYPYSTRFQDESCNRHISNSEVCGLAGGLCRLHTSSPHAFQTCSYVSPYQTVRLRSSMEQSAKRYSNRSRVAI